MWGLCPTGSHHLCLSVYWLLQYLWRTCYLFCGCGWCWGQDDLSVTLWCHCLIKVHPVWRIGLRPVRCPIPSRHRRKWGRQRLIKYNYFLSLLPDISCSTWGVWAERAVHSVAPYVSRIQVFKSFLLCFVVLCACTVSACLSKVLFA